MGQYHWKNRAEGRRVHQCKQCVADNSAAWYQDNRARMKRVRSRHATKLRAEYHSLKDQPCADCGGRFPHYVMEFDHVRGTRNTPVARLQKSARSRLRAEVQKCDLVCANCHKVRTHRRRQAMRA